MDELINPNTGKPRKRKAREAPMALEPGDNTKYTMQALTLAQLKPIDTDDAAEVQQRSIEYFEICVANDMKPNIAGYALALGVHRTTLLRWRYDTSNKPKEVRDIISIYIDAIAEMMEAYMQNGKINPVSGIFLMKNNFGYQDKTEIAIEPKVQNEDNLESIRESARLLPD